MMEKVSKILTWQMVTLLVAGGVVFGAIALLAPPDVRELLLGANGLVATIIAYFLRSPNSGPPPPPPPVMTMLGAFTFAGVAAGCGASAQHALSSQAEVIVHTRAARLDFYESEHARCLDASPSLIDYDACMAPSRHVARAVDSYRETLFAAQAALNAGAGGEPLIACVIDGAKHLVAALVSAHAPVPEEVSQIAALVPEGFCHE